MKHLGNRVLGAIFAVAMISSILCTIAFATVKSSEYLDGYSATVTPKAGGSVSVSVDVSARGRMTEIGAKTIYIYESSDGKNFTCVATYQSSEYPAMMSSGMDYIKTPITHQGTTGYYYYAAVYVYAGDATGGDTRRIETSVKKAI